MLVLVEHLGFHHVDYLEEVVGADRLEYAGRETVDDLVQLGLFDRNVQLQEVRALEFHDDGVLFGHVETSGQDSRVDWSIEEEILSWPKKSSSCLTWAVRQLNLWSSK